MTIALKKACGISSIVLAILEGIMKFKNDKIKM